MESVSSLARGKWIEAPFCQYQQVQKPSSLARGKWIEAELLKMKWDMIIASSLARGKWIEAALPWTELWAQIRLPSQEGSGLKLHTRSSYS